MTDDNSVLRDYTIRKRWAFGAACFASPSRLRNSAWHVAVGRAGSSKFSQRSRRAMLRLEHARGFLVSGEGFEANAPPLNNKAGNFAGVGENGCHRGA
jgi:hypothetical protein